MTEGKVHIEGDPRLTLGYAALDMALYPTLSVAEHLVFSADLRGIEPRTDELLDRIGLQYARDYPAASLSSGMKARLKLAMAIQPRPQVLLLDEPGASLDEAGRCLVEKIAEEQASYGALIVATNESRERRLATDELVLAP
jgi:ABC-type multidrug transport system ATPase subunit